MAEVLLVIGNLGYKQYSPLRDALGSPPYSHTDLTVVKAEPEALGDDLWSIVEGPEEDFDADLDTDTESDLEDDLGEDAKASIAVELHLEEQQLYWDAFLEVTGYRADEVVAILWLEGAYERVEDIDKFCILPDRLIVATINDGGQLNIITPAPI